jgi:hypothetical protein
MRAPQLFWKPRQLCKKKGNAMKKRPIIIAATLLLILTTTSAMAGIVVLETDGNGKPTRCADPTTYLVVTCP